VHVNIIYGGLEMVNPNRNVTLITARCPFCGHPRAWKKMGMNVNGTFCSRCGAKHQGEVKNDRK